ncbi:hypothetical protein NQZ68_026413 [Dissostichus eleginoides]|nr:hypothetical protein NQZ68_026413 [Dissostichus eleginoides]
MKTITGFKGRDRLTVGTLERANELNTCFNRFCSPPAAAVSSTSTTQHPPSATLASDPPPPLSPLLSSLDSTTTTLICPPRFTVSTGQVQRQMQKLHQGKAAGPDVRDGAEEGGGQDDRQSEINGNGQKKVTTRGEAE